MQSGWQSPARAGQAGSRGESGSATCCDGEAQQKGGVCSSSGSAAEAAVDQVAIEAGAEEAVADDATCTHVQREVR